MLGVIGASFLDVFFNVTGNLPCVGTRSENLSNAAGFKLWNILVRNNAPSEHKNVFFSYIRASQAPPDPEAAAIADAASTQLAGFRRPPFRREYRDNSSTYLEDPACPGNSLVAIDVKDRIPADFIWQKSPFKLVTKIPSSRYVYPGVDYLVAYWMGRYHGFLEDDSAGSIIPSLVPLLLK